jgi:hypothetical protein
MVKFTLCLLMFAMTAVPAVGRMIREEEAGLETHNTSNTIVHPYHCRIKRLRETGSE